MAEIVGCVAMSHGPQLLTPPDKWPELPTRIKGPFHPKAGIAADLTPDAMRAHADRCNAAIGKLGDKLRAWNPDVLVVIGDDQEENILADNTPPFTIFMGKEADATLHYTYFGNKEESQITRYQVDAPLAESLLVGLMDEQFDPSWSRETRYHGGLGHAFGRALKLLLPDCRIPIVPVMVNTYYPPAPSAKRCFDFGAAMGRVLARQAGGKRIAIVGSGGMSHTKIDEGLDQKVIKAIETNDGKYLSSLPSDVLVTGTSEIRNWIVVAGAAGASGKMVDYVPCYRNDLGVGCAMGFAVWERAAA
jgi:hypothetical protein